MIKHWIILRPASPLVILCDVTEGYNSKKPIKVSSLQVKMQGLLHAVQMVLSNFLNICYAVHFLYKCFFGKIYLNGD